MVPTGPDAALPRGLLSLLSLLAAGLVVSMLVLYAATGVSQDALQFFRRPDDYAALLLQAPQVLKLAVALDTAFLFCYGAAFVVLGSQLQALCRPRALVVLGTGLMVATALLDLVENMHFLAMLARADAGEPPGAGEIHGQVWESLVKFHVSYLGMFLLGWALPARTAAEQALALLLRWVQWPAGIALYVVPAALVKSFAFGRFAFYLAALLLLALIWRPRAGGSGAPA
jgi:hypothetical protein